MDTQKFAGNTGTRIAGYILPGIIDPNRIPRTANAYRQTVGIPVKSLKRVKMSRTSEHHTSYISEEIQTRHYFVGDLMKCWIRGRISSGNWAHEEPKFTSRHCSHASKLVSFEF